MLDFVKIVTSTSPPNKRNPEGCISIYPEFKVGPSDDLMVRGKAFYAVWDEEAGMWSRDEDVVINKIDSYIYEKRDEFPDDVTIEMRLMRNFSSKKWTEFLAYMGSLPDNYHELDNKLIFSDQTVVKEDYASRKLPYPLKAGSYDAYDEIMSTLYDPVERQKLEWAIGSVVAGDSKDIQKFVVLYGTAGSGKSTVLNIIQLLFQGYFNMFEAKALAQSSNAFALEAFKNNPLVSIQHDGDLSKIEDNTKINSIVSHEIMVVNEKYKASYESRFNTFLFMGTNRPVRITDAKSGIVRRLIDVHPSGDRLSFDRYQMLMSQVKFELGAIAWHCLQVYSSLGKSAYDNYRPIEMMGATNDFYNFVEDHVENLRDGTTLTAAWALYKKWTEETAVPYPMSRRLVKEELKNYYKTYEERKHVANGAYLRCVYSDFDIDKFDESFEPSLLVPGGGLVLTEKRSLFDKLASDYPAQYASEKTGGPVMRWDRNRDRLHDIDTSKLHFVQVPDNHIVIDFDLKGEDGEKSLERNLVEAGKWPTTYAELSRSGKGVHLHYIYSGDVEKLARVYDDNIEIKVFTGNSALRRQLTFCNDKPIAILSHGLPLKEEKGGKKVLDYEGYRSEASLRELLERTLRKEVHPNTTPSIQFVVQILQQAYDSGMTYDVSDLKPDVISVAAGSTHNARKCLKLIEKMHFKSEDPFEDGGSKWMDPESIYFFDIEIFPNLFVVVVKREGDHEPMRMVNPSPMEIERITHYKLVGFNNRRYDNHILYARMTGSSNMDLYHISKRIVGGSNQAMFGAAYNLSYTDIYDFASKKQSLKKWEIELGIHHQELGLPWDDPVDESLWDKVTEYCVNDVIATEAVFNARKADWAARQILAQLSGKTVNDPNRVHAQYIIFGKDKNPQKEFVYTDLSEMFPGYKFEYGKSTYMGVEIGEGGLVYAEPGVYFDIDVEDVASMHPHSAAALNIFGDRYTQRFVDLMEGRMAIKHHDYEKAGSVLDGALKPYLGEVDDDDLAYALKIIINSIYGLTAAKFDNVFRDPRNKDNIVAKRGALFMMNLKKEVQDRGFTVAHIKTDSIKIPNATPDILKFVEDYGKAYGYTFELEHHYERMCLVNDAVYVARVLNKDGSYSWEATGKQFQIPYVFKTLFSHEPVIFDDYVITMNVSGDAALYLDMDERLEEGQHDYRFVGKAGAFVPIKDGCGGGRLLRGVDGRYGAATGTKGYRWLEAETVRLLGKEGDVDVGYFEALAEEAIKTIEKFGNFEEFVKE